MMFLSSLVPRVQGTVIEGGSAVNTLVADADITNLNYSNMQVLAVENVTLTASELNGFAAIVSAFGSTPFPGLPTPVIEAATAGTYSLAGVSTDLINLRALTNGGTTLIGNDAAAEKLVASTSGNDTLIAGNGGDT